MLIGRRARVQLVAAAVVVFCLATRTTFGQRVPIINDNDVPLSVWVEREAVGAFDRSPIQLQRHDYGYIDVSTPGQYYVTLMDRQRREFGGEWLYLREKLAADPYFCLKCSAIYETSGVKKNIWHPELRRFIWEWRPIQKFSGFEIEESSLRPAPPAPPPPVIYYYVPAAP